MKIIHARFDRLLARCDTYECGVMFQPYRLPNGTVGQQSIICYAVETDIIMATGIVERTISPFTSAEVKQFLNSVFTAFGKPLKSVSFCPSLFASSSELRELKADDLFHQDLYGLEFGPMREEEKSKVTSWLNSFGLSSDWNVSN